MGLHRDGELLGLQPFETEMRRRIWWQIIMLETKYAILAGFCDTLLPPNWDTQLPSNVNDADLLPGSAEPVRSREGATEMAFCLMLYESRQFFCENPMDEFEAVILRAGDASAQTTLDAQSLERYRVIVDEFEERFLQAERRYCNPTIGGIHVMACRLRPLLVQRLRDMMAHARETRDQEAEGPGRQSSFFKVWVINFEGDIEWYDSIDERFRWYPKLHLQSDAFSVMIELLQWQPVDAIVDRAWRVVDRVYHHHPELYDLGKKENLQRAENLMAGWQRREAAFCGIGQTCEMPAVIEKLRASGIFPATRTGPAEQWATPAPDPTLFPGLGTTDFSGFSDFDGNVLLNPDAASFLWDVPGGMPYSQP